LHPSVYGFRAGLASARPRPVNYPSTANVLLTFASEASNSPPPTAPQDRRLTHFETGCNAEQIACNALKRDGFNIIGRRMRTSAGEIDAVAERDGLTVFVEVKARRKLADAAAALQPRQQARLTGAAEILLGQNPHWGRAGIRFDVMAVDCAGRVRRISDAIRQF
jgi:putative endonuclease